MVYLNNSILSSVPFKFLVGPDRKCFMVHSALIAHHSKPLGILINGDMSEAWEGCALLEGIDEHTFVRFGQYAYTGDYIAADPETLLNSSAIATTHSVSNRGLPNPVEDDTGKAFASATFYPETKAMPDISVENVDDPWRSFGISKKKMKKGGSAKIADDADPFVVAARSQKSKLWDSFKDITYAISEPTIQIQTNSVSCENFTVVFLCHARLYAFADQYDITPLKRLTLHKLHQTLVRFTLYDERVDDIVTLIRYSYSNTADLPGSVDNMRLLVVHYAACKVEHLARNTKFCSLLEEPGSFAKDLVEQMLRRLD